MNILIIGGSKFIGYHLTRQLIRDGHRITFYNRGITPDDFGRDVVRIRGDRNNYKDFKQKLSGKSYDVVIDMIAFAAEDSRTAVETFQGRVGHFIHISTAAVYIVTRNFHSPLKEEDFNRPLVSKRMMEKDVLEYGFKKRQCENVLMQAHDKIGFPVTIFRFPVVMGERDYTLRAYSYFLRIQDEGPIILPDGGLNVSTHVYQGDIVRTIASNLGNQAAFGESYNLAQDEMITLREFVKIASELIGTSVELIDIPSEILKIASMGTSFSPLFHRRPFVLDIHKAVKDLGFTPTDIRTWLEKTIRWFQNEYEGDPPENYKLRPKELEFVNEYKTVVRYLIKR